MYFIHAFTLALNLKHGLYQTKVLKIKNKIL